MQKIQDDAEEFLLDNTPEEPKEEGTEEDTKEEGEGGELPRETPGLAPPACEQPHSSRWGERHRGVAHLMTH